MKNIFVVGRMLGYANWMQGKLVNDLKEADLVVFTGGEDVSPSLYGEPTGKYTGCNYGRDMFEKTYFEEAVTLGIPIVGICRGSQLVCVLSGGRLVQHQDNPSFIHDIITSAGKVLPITSTHHQAQYPYDMPLDAYTVLGWTEGISPMHWDGTDKEISPIAHAQEVEIAYYPKTKALGIQGHPEMIWDRRNDFKPTFDYLRGLLDDLLENKL